SASEDHTVKVWDLSNGQEALTLRAHTDTVRAVAFSPDGWRLATASADGTVKIWDATPSGADRPSYELRTLPGARAPLFAAAFHPDGRRVAAASDDQTIRVWDAFTGAPLPGQQVSWSSPVFTAVYSPDGGVLATATNDGIVWLLEAATGRVQRALRSQRNGPI